MPYLLDASVFIQAKNLQYGFDICPAFWEWLVEADTQGVVFSLQQVLDELKGQKSELTEWATTQATGLFVGPSGAIVPELRSVAQWASNSHHEPSAVHLFLQVADHMLVAYALAHSCTMVTHEVTSDAKKKIKIPDACLALSVECVSPYVMLRRRRPVRACVRRGWPPLPRARPAWRRQVGASPVRMPGC